MAAVRSLRAQVKSDSGSDRSDSDSESESDRDAREAEPMEVEEGELEPDDITVNRSLKELLPDTSRRYENKAGTFITGIDVNSKEAIEKKEKRARRFHFRAEVNLTQRDVVLDTDMMKKALPKVRLEAIYVTGVDNMSTQDVFAYFKEYPPAHIEWIDDTSCNVVWLDDVTSTRALINISRMPDTETVVTVTEDTKTSSKPSEHSKGCRNRDSDEDEEEGEVEEETVKRSSQSVSNAEDGQKDHVSQIERDSLFRNDLRTAVKPFKGNKLFLRFATQEDRKELGAARRSRYYMKYGNPNYGGMKGILSNSWKRRYHTRRIQRDVIKSKKPLIGDSMGHTPPYTHRHSADLVNLPEEPIEEEDEDDEDMDSDDRVVEYREKGNAGGLRTAGSGGLRGRAVRASSSDSDEMDYDLELKMISTPSPKKSMKMTMYADELETNLKNIRNSMQGDSASGSGGVRDRIGGRTKPAAPSKVTDVRQLLEEKRQGSSQQKQHPKQASAGKMDVRQRLGKRRRPASPDSLRDTLLPREPLTDVHSRLGVASQESKTLSSKDRKSNALWSRLGSADDGLRESRPSGVFSSSSRVDDRKRRDEEVQEEKEDEEEEEDDSRLQRVWGAMIKQKQQVGSMKKSRLDNLPSLQIEISRDSSEASDTDT